MLGDCSDDTYQEDGYFYWTVCTTELAPTAVRLTSALSFRLSH